MKIKILKISLCIVSLLSLFTVHIISIKHNTYFIGLPFFLYALLMEISEGFQPVLLVTVFSIISLISFSAINNFKAEVVSIFLFVSSIWIIILFNVQLTKSWPQLLPFLVSSIGPILLPFVNIKSKSIFSTYIFIIGFSCLSLSIILSQMSFFYWFQVGTVDLITKSLWIVGSIVPFVIVVFWPKKFFLPAVLYFFLLLSSVNNGIGLHSAIGSHYWSSVNYGTPIEIAKINYYKGGEWLTTANNIKYWSPVYSQNIKVFWWKLIQLITLSNICAVTVIVLRILLKKILTLYAVRTNLKPTSKK
jgi:hypothetical protein